MAKDKVSWPAWYYGPDGGRIFQCAEDVPEGWQTSPLPKRPAAEIVAEADLNGDGVIEPSKAEVIKALRDRGVKFDARWGIARLRALL